MENHNAKHFVLQLGSLITLYLSVSFLLVLLFAIINLLFPDAAENYYMIESFSSSVRMGIAMLIVFFPTYLILTRKINIIRRSETSGSYSGVTKWLIYLSLLIGGGVLLGDLVAVIYSFLNGELTTRFILKAVVLMVVVGMAFYYYLQDTRGFWIARERYSAMYAGMMSALVVASLVMGFFHIDTPAVVREMKLDEKQVIDLQDIQFRIENYLQLNNELPKTVAELYVGVDLPGASEGRDDYEYKLTDKGFALCAEFGLPSQNTETLTYPIEDNIKNAARNIKGGNNWDHKAGWYCFERVVN